MDQLTNEEKLHAQLVEAATDPPAGRARLEPGRRRRRARSVEAEWLEAAERAEG
ncbi:hypothetical protein HBB16_14320 [Pseudonocardia sp. MCCB 268]|nr:hypothetical protein [Pseudonocardia cytotoxica]